MDLGRYVLKFLTERLEVDLIKIHIAFWEIFKRRILVVMILKTVLKSADAKIVRQKHFARHYEFETRLGRLKRMPKTMHPIVFTVKTCRDHSHAFSDFERIGKIRLEDTFLQFHRSKDAKHRYTTMAPSFKYNEEYMFPSRQERECFVNRTKYSRRSERTKKKGPVCYELRTFGRCSFLDRGMACFCRHPSYLADRNIPKPKVFVDSDGGRRLAETTLWRCSRCTLPLSSTSLESGEDAETNPARSLCDRCRSSRRPARAVFISPHYRKRPAAVYESLCLKRGIAVGTHSARQQRRSPK